MAANASDVFTPVAPGTTSNTLLQSSESTETRDKSSQAAAAAEARRKAEWARGVGADAALQLEQQSQARPAPSQRGSERDVADSFGASQAANIREALRKSSIPGGRADVARIVSRPMSLRIGHECVDGRVAAYAGRRFQALKTNGDGACAVHSVFGMLSGGEYRHPFARRFLSYKLGATAGELRDRAKNDVMVSEFFMWLWSDVVKPQAKTHADLDAGDHALDDEAKAIWLEIQKEPVLCDMCVNHVRHEQHAYEMSQGERAGLLEKFEPLFDRRFQDTFVRPLLTSLGLLEDYVDSPWHIEGLPGVSNKFDGLFEQCCDGRRFRQSVLEYLGVHDFSPLFQRVQDVVQGIDPLPDDLATVLFPFTEALTEARGQGVGYRAGSVPAFFDQVYPKYLAALTSQDGDYYLSPQELALVCQCDQRNVVIARHDLDSGSLEYDRHVMPAPTSPEIRFTSIQVRSGATRVRSHFERLELLP